MQIGMIGLGRMGANMTRRLMAAGHHCVVHDVDDDAIRDVVDDGAEGAHRLTEFVERLARPRSIWIMVPAGYVGATLDELAPLLDDGDVVVDGGNSSYREAIGRSEALAERGIAFLDVGTSGGVHGLERGYCLMVGGAPDAVDQLSPMFDALAPGIDAAERTPGRSSQPDPAEHGWLHCGPPGAGHFVKMVHNGIEYGMMAAMAEGLALLAAANADDDGGHYGPPDSSAMPAPDPRYYGYEFDLAAITEVWRRGSVVGSWLLDLTAQALLGDPYLEGYEGRVDDSGEGRWTLEAALDVGTPVPVIAASVFQRFSSRGRSAVADRALSAMRAGFGGHLEPPGDRAPTDPGAAS